MEEQIEVKELEHVVVLFSGDSGDGMQLAGNIFSNVSATVGNGISTFPDYPADIRAPQGSLNGVSGYRVQIGAGKVYTPGDKCDVLVAMNAADEIAHRTLTCWEDFGKSYIIGRCLWCGTANYFEVMAGHARDMYSNPKSPWKSIRF